MGLPLPKVTCAPAGLPPQHSGCLPVAQPCCQEYMPGFAVDAAQRAWAGGQSGARPPASFSSVRAGAAYMWSANPRLLALALALTSACAAAGSPATKGAGLVAGARPGGANGCRCEENAGLSHLAAGLSLGTEGSPWASCLCLPWREETPASWSSQWTAGGWQTQAGGEAGSQWLRRPALDPVLLQTLAVSECGYCRGAAPFWGTQGALEGGTCT